MLTSFKGALTLWAHTSVNVTKDCISLTENAEVRKISLHFAFIFVFHFISGLTGRAGDHGGRQSLDDFQCDLLQCL